MGFGVRWRDRSRNCFRSRRDQSWVRRLGRAAFALSCFLVLCSPLWAQRRRGAHSPNKEDLPILLHAAGEALKAADYAAAVKALKSAVEIEPQLTAAWFNLAYAYSGLRQNERAIEAYQKALELEPDLFEARLNAGILLIQMKRPEPSLEHLEKAVTLKPENPRAHLYYGEALSVVRKPELAEKQLREALRLDPGLAKAELELGQLYLGQKRYAEARSAFQRAAALDSKLAQASLGNALASEALNDLADAARGLEQHLLRKPEDLGARFHLARIYLRQGQKARALENLETVYRAKPDLPGLAAALGDVYALMRKFPESEKFYRQALSAHPAEADLHRALGRTLLDEEKFADAEAEFRAALKLDPKNREAAKGLATSLYLEKRYAESIPLLEALARAPDPPAILFFQLATCYDHLQDVPKALDAYERFLGVARGQIPDPEWQARQRVKVLRRELRK